MLFRSSLKVKEPVSLQEALRQMPSEDTGVVFHPGASALDFRSWAQSLTPKTKLHLFFGPEGGFTEKEMAYFESKKMVKVRLVDTLLKADTALLGVAAAVRFLSA